MLTKNEETQFSEWLYESGQPEGGDEMKKTLHVEVDKEMKVSALPCGCYVVVNRPLPGAWEGHPSEPHLVKLCNGHLARHMATVNAQVGGCWPVYLKGFDNPEYFNGHPAASLEDVARILREKGVGDYKIVARTLTTYVRIDDNADAADWWAAARASRWVPDCIATWIQGLGPNCIQLTFDEAREARQWARIVGPNSPLVFEKGPRLVATYG